MAIIKQLKKGNSIYPFNKQPYIIDKKYTQITNPFYHYELIEDIKRFHNIQFNWAVFEPYYTSPSYIAEAQVFTDAENTPFVNSSFLPLNITAPLETTQKYYQTNLDSIDIKNDHCIINYEGSNIAYVIIRTVGGVLDVKDFNQVTSCPAEERSIANLNSFQIISDIIFNDNELTFKIIPILSNEYTMIDPNGNVSIETKVSNGYSLFTGRTSIGSGNYSYYNGDYNNYIRLSNLINNSQIPSSSSLELAASNLEERYSHGNTCTTSSYTATGSYVIIQRKVLLEYAIVIQIPNYQNKKINYATPYYYLMSQIDPQHTELVYIINTSTNHFTKSTYKAIMNMFLIQPQDQNIYFYRGKIQQYNQNNNTFIDVNNDYIYFTQSEIDSIFNS